MHLQSAVKGLHIDDIVSLSDCLSICDVGGH